MRPSITPDFSIVICTHNRAQLLKRCLNSIINSYQNFPCPIEVIVVNNASTDNTDEVARAFDGHPANVRLFYEPQPGKAYALWTGIRNATGNYLVSLDDDNFVKDETIRVISEIIKRYPHHLIGSVNIPLFEEEGPPFWFEQLKAALACGPQAESFRLSGAVWGAGMISPMSALKSLVKNNFQFSVSCRKGKKLSSGSDTELSYILRFMGLEAVFPEDYQIFHLIPKERLRLSYVARLYFSFGSSDPFIYAYRHLVPAIRDVPYKSKIQTFRFCLERIVEHLWIVTSKKWRFQVFHLATALYFVGFLYQTLRAHKAILAADRKIRNFCATVLG